jgi:hypothetical protein
LVKVLSIFLTMILLGCGPADDQAGQSQAYYACHKVITAIATKHLECGHFGIDSLQQVLNYNLQQCDSLSIRKLRDVRAFYQVCLPWFQGLLSQEELKRYDLYNNLLCEDLAWLRLSVPQECNDQFQTNQRDSTMKLSTQPVNPLSLQEGDLIFVDSDGAHSLSLEAAIAYQLKEEYKAPEGLSYVSQAAHNIDPGKFQLFVPLVRPVSIISLHHKAWDPSKDAGIPLMFNQQGDVISGNFQMTYESFLFRAFPSINDITTLNKDRWTCICCGTKLKVPIQHLRVCPQCESTQQ